jgi:hypothetical protein
MGPFTLARGMETFWHDLMRRQAIGFVLPTECNGGIFIYKHVARKYVTAGQS